MIKKLISSIVILAIAIATTTTLLSSQEISFKEMWKEVKKLQDEQKYNTALKKVIKIYDIAVKKENYKQWAKALARSVALERGLHGYENAVHFFMEKKWPPSDKEKAMLHLFFANTDRKSTRLNSSHYS